MFERTSRYYGIDTATISTTDPDGRERVVSYVRRRVIPSYDDQPTLVEHVVEEGDRLDNVTARYLGDPTQFWLLCDANLALRPDELEEIGRVIRVKMPRF
jgi:hypothetical protein